MKKAENKRFHSVWDALEDTPGAAESMKLRSKLMIVVQDGIREAGKSQRDAANLLGLTQPVLAKLVRGRVDLFTVDSLIPMLHRLGMKIDFRLKKAI